MERPEAASRCYPGARFARTRQVEVFGTDFLVIDWSPEQPPRLAALTQAEREVAELAARGATNAEIARARGTSPRTVANQIATIFRKLGVGSCARLAAALAGGR